MRRVDDTGSSESVDLHSEAATQPMVTSRRDFLKLSAQTLGLVGLAGLTPNVRAAETRSIGGSESILVLIHLAGGNDGLNTIVPLSDDRYYRLRPTLAIKATQVLRLSDHHGLHPACRGLHDLYLGKRLSVLPHVGASSLSHFGATDAWSSVIRPTHAPASGWLGRLLAQTSDANTSAPAAIHFSDQLPACLHGAKPRTIYSLQAPVAFERLCASARAKPLIRQRVSRKFPSTLIGQHLQKVATLIAGESGARIYHLTLSGFDTHSHQAAAHAQLLQSLSDGLAAFDQQLQQAGIADRVLTVAYSEFGRTLQENERLGTDHAPAGPVFLIGNPGAINLPGLHSVHTRAPEPAMDTPSDCRQVLAALARDWLHCPEAVPVA